MVSSNKKKSATEVNKSENISFSLLDTDEHILGNVSFAIGYLSDYRYHKQLLLELEYDTVEEAIPNLKLEQYENLKQMLEVEMIINAVQYCSELAAFAICIKNKKRNNLIQFLSSLAEADIKIFYDNIGNADFNKLKEFMGYKEIKFNEDEISKYTESCIRFKRDVERLSSFYNKHYSLFTAYKHGLRLIPYFDEIQQKKIILEACKDNCLAVCKIPQNWRSEAIDVIHTINNIYQKLYIPFIRLKFFEYAGISPEELPPSTFTINTDVKNLEGSIHYKLSFKLPWFNHDGKTPEPFY